jgi:outer membrane protein assembly factor BamB
VTTRPVEATPAEPNWVTFQHDAKRSGETAGSYNPARLRQLWESEPLDGLVYAQVLVVADRAFVVTQNNTVYALDVASGHAAWTQHLGTPVPRSALQCGNVDPTGLLSTPVIDLNEGALYAVDYVDQRPRHNFVGLDLKTGAVRSDNPIDPLDADPVPLQQRAALTLGRGTAYVPFGGLFGDCGDYHGWIVSVGLPDGHRRGAYQVPARRGGVWSAPLQDGDGDLYATTSNGDSTTSFDYGNSVIRLSSDLKLLDFFAPSDWADLNQHDMDLGSSGPILLDEGQVLQVGKSGVGYLLDSRSLGQIGADTYHALICAGGAYAGAAHVGTMVYVACKDGLAAVQVKQNAFIVVWRGPQFNASPPTITTDAVWTVDDDTGALYALNRYDGSVLTRAPPTHDAANPPHFVSPSAAGGRLFLSRGKTIVAYSAN